MTESERKKIIDLYESGMAVTQIQRLMAMTEAEFKRAVTELRASGDLPKRETNVTMAKVAEALASGETNPFKICEDYGISYDNFRKCKSKLGIKSGRPKRNYCYTEKALAVTNAGAHVLGESRFMPVFKKANTVLICYN